MVPGINVNERIDLIKRLDIEEASIIDFKSTERVQAEDVTRSQFHTYAIGYRQLTGEDADLMEILNLDKAGKNVRDMVDDHMLTEIENSIRNAGSSIRKNCMGRPKQWCGTCAGCDFVSLCRDNQ